MIQSIRIIFLEHMTPNYFQFVMFRKIISTNLPRTSFGPDQVKRRFQRLFLSDLGVKSIWLNSQAVGRALGRPSGFQTDIVQNFTYPNSSSQNVYSRFEHFNSFGALQISHRKPLNREKNDFSKADLGISPKNRIQAAVKILNDGEILLKLYVIFKGPFKIYKDYQIVP